MRAPLFSRSAIILAAGLGLALTSSFATAQTPGPDGPKQSGEARPAITLPIFPAPKPYDLVPVTLPPAYNDPSFEVFRKQLGDVARRKDRRALGNLVVARNFFWVGEQGDRANRRKSGIDNLAAALELDAKDGGGWQALEEAARDPTLEQFTDRKGVLCAPANPTYDERAADQVAKQTDTEPDDWGYPNKAGIEVREAPRPDAAIIEKLGLNLVRVISDDAPPGASPRDSDYLRIVTPSGKVGYINESDLSSLNPEQVCYAKEGTSWKIAGFIGEQ